jgi:multiple sugar transport system substrate-binding protein/putative aldouronate transport system substrate-binding protein
MLRFFNKLYQNNLLDPNSMTQTFDAMTAKVVNGGTFFSIFNFSGSLAYNTGEHIEANKMMLSMVPEAATPIVYGMNVLGGNRVWSIGAKSQYPELCMEILNWLCTPYGRMVTEYGPYGVTWYYDESGNTYSTELGKAMHYDNRTTFPQESGYHGSFGDGDFEINNTTWSLDAENPDSNGERFNWDYWKSNQTEPLNLLEAEWRTRNNALTTQEYLDNTNYKVALGTAYSESRRSATLKVKWEQVTKTIVDYSWQAIYASSDGAFNFIVNTMISKANTYGYADCVAWSQNEAAIRFAMEEAIRNATP